MAEVATEPGVVPLLRDMSAVVNALAISPRHVRRLVAGGDFGPTPVRLGRAVRFRADEIRAWAGAGCPPRSKWQWKPGEDI